MVLGAGSRSSSTMGFDNGKEGSEKNEGIETRASKQPQEEDVGDEDCSIDRESEVSAYATEGEDEDEEGKIRIELGPQCTIKEQLEKDKDDESLRRWKEQLLGSVAFDSAGETLEPDVKILTLAIISPGRPDVVLQIPEVGNPKGLWFTLKEGSTYSLRFSFSVSNNIVSGLRYNNTVWKTGIKVDRRKEMLGVFSPQAEPYTHEMPEETTPSGIFSRGSYSARTKFLDDDNKCYLEMNYTFDIRREWPSK